MSVFNVDWSAVSEQGKTPRFDEGRTEATITEIKIKPSKDPARPGEVLFICEAQDDVGAVRSVLFEIAKDPFGYGKSDAKSLVAAALNVPFAEVTDKMMTNAMGPAQTCKGRRLAFIGTKQEKMTGRGKERRGTGEYFVKITFQSLGEASAPAVSDEAPAIPELETKTASVFPPAGWAVHPKNSKYYHNGKEVLTEEQLRARV